MVKKKMHSLKGIIKKKKKKSLQAENTNKKKKKLAVEKLGSCFEARRMKNSQEDIHTMNFS